MITGLDISHYQEQEFEENSPYNKYIDWVKLKNNNPSYNFKFIWIKFSEGELLPTDQDAYPIEAAKRQVAGAKRVNFDIINGYHFYYFQVPMSIDNNGNYGTWYTLNNDRQAEAFYQSYLLAECEIKHPMADLEDPYIRSRLQWSDTESANRAISYAVKLLTHIFSYLEKLEIKLGKRPDIYTGKWWLDLFVPLLINNGFKSLADKLNTYKYILADYEGNLDIPSYINKENVIAWQKTSTPVPYVNGIPTGTYGPGSNLDVDEWYQSEDKYLEWIGVKMGIYKESVSNINKAGFAFVSAEDKNINIAKICENVDMLDMMVCTQVSTNMNITKDNAFPVWVERATKPVRGWVGLDADLFWKKEIDLETFTKNTDKRNMWTNEILRGLLEQWRKDGIPSVEWDNKHLNISANDGGWHKLSALVLYMSTTNYTAGGSQIGGSWQQAIVDDILKPLTTLMQGGYIPNIPIYLAANVKWYQLYASNPEWTIKNNVANGQLKGLGVLRNWGEEGSDLIITDKAPMATPYTSLSEAWVNVPKDGYTYPFTFDWAPFKFFIFSWNRIRAEDVFYVGTENITTTVLGIWCDVKEELYKELNFSQTVEQSSSPSSSISPSTQIPQTGLEERVTILESKIQMILNIINENNMTVTDRLNTLRNLLQRLDF